jgi:hypothetical protein
MSVSISKKTSQNFFNNNNELPIKNLMQIIEKLKLAMNSSPKLSKEGVEKIKKNFLKALSQ